MFKTLGHFANVECPEIAICKRQPCLFSHKKAIVPVISQTAAPKPLQAIATRTRPVEVPSERPLKRLKVDSDTSESKVVSQNGLQKDSDRSAASSAVQQSKSTNSNSLRATLGLKTFSVAASHSPYKNRMQILNLFHAEFVRIYATAQSPPAERDNLARLHASEQEDEVYRGSNKNTYRNIAAQALARLKKRACVRDLREGGTENTIEARKAEAIRLAKLELLSSDLIKYSLNNYDGWQNDYITEIPDARSDALATDVGKVKNCKRCKSEFVLKSDLSPDDLEACRFHWGRMVTDTANGPKRRIYSCCRSAGEPCTRGPHVYEDTKVEDLHAKCPFAKTGSIAKADKHLTAVAFDCEMVYSTSGLSLARITALSPSGDSILDEHVRLDPAQAIDFNTRFSGVTAKDLDGAVFDVAGVRQAFCSLVGPETFLIGHGLENDLKALRLIHSPERIIDTAIIFRNPQGYRMALRVLTKMHLKRFTQDEGFHDSKEDSLNAMELLRWKIAEDRKQRV